MNDKNFEKLDLTLKYYLYGAKYSTALKAYRLAKKLHTGFRKDNVTPEVQHQLEIALFIVTLRLKPEHEELAITYALLHDVMEDFPEVTFVSMIDNFGTKIADDLKLISKYIEGEKNFKTYDKLFERMSKVPLIALVKGVDRIHNLQSMNGVFDHKKQTDYVSEAQMFFLPMLKTASYIDDELFFSFQNVRTVLKCQIALIEAMLNSVQTSNNVI